MGDPLHLLWPFQGLKSYATGNVIFKRHVQGTCIVHTPTRRPEYFSSFSAYLGIDLPSCKVSVQFTANLLGLAVQGFRIHSIYGFLFN